MVDITSMVQGFREYDDQLQPETEETLGSDILYRTLVTNLSEVKQFNYRSNYWGSADYYQEAHIEFMRELKPYIGKQITLDGITGKLLGLLIDRQYNNLGHSALLIEPTK